MRCSTSEMQFRPSPALVVARARAPPPTGVSSLLCAPGDISILRRHTSSGRSNELGRLPREPAGTARSADREQRMPPVVVAFPDCFTRLGGNQYINSASMGAWEDFLLHECCRQSSGASAERNCSSERIARMEPKLTKCVALTYPGQSPFRTANSVWLSATGARRLITIEENFANPAACSAICVRFNNSGQKVYKGGDLLMSQFELDVAIAAYNAEAVANSRSGLPREGRVRVPGERNAVKP